jgi:hypothetical protein
MKRFIPNPADCFTLTAARDPLTPTLSSRGEGVRRGRCNGVPSPFGEKDKMRAFSQKGSEQPDSASSCHRLARFDERAGKTRALAAYQRFNVLANAFIRDTLLKWKAAQSRGSVVNFRAGLPAGRVGFF